MTGSHNLKKLARIAIVLLLTGAVGFLAGLSDDNDDNFGFASLEPAISHSAARTSRFRKIPDGTNSPTRLMPPFARSASLEGCRVKASRLGEANSLEGPLRT